MRIEDPWILDTASLHQGTDVTPSAGATTGVTPVVASAEEAGVFPAAPPAGATGVIPPGTSVGALVEPFVAPVGGVSAAGGGARVVPFQ